MPTKTVLITDVIALAREEYQGATDAEFDYHLAGGQETALLALDRAFYELANKDRPEPQRPWGDDEHDARATAAKELRQRLQKPLDAFIAWATARPYVGWSDYSQGPIRYAEEAAQE